MNRRSPTLLFLNIGHTLDHLMMLIFPTAVLAMAPEFGRSYDQLLPLAFGGFVAFAAGSLPAGWLGDRWSRRGMMAVFFIGIGVSGMLTGLAQTPMQVAGALTLIGLFAAIYHPVGLAMLVDGQDKVGRLLGVNGVWGNLGIAFAALTAGALADLVGWRAAFLVPGVVALAVGIGFLVLVPPQPPSARKRAAAGVGLPPAIVRRIFAVLLVSTVFGGVIFNAATIAMPKLFDERLTSLTRSTLGVGVFVCLVYLLAAVAQLIVGRLIDRLPLKTIFVSLVALMAPLLLVVASGVANWGLLVASIALMFFVFGVIPVNDTIVARHTDAQWRARVYALRYLASLGASSLAVPLVAVLHDWTGGFGRVFVMLAVFAAFMLVAASLFPAMQPEMSALPAE